jgi:hypothetical protein
MIAIINSSFLIQTIASELIPLCYYDIIKINSINLIDPLFYSI